MPLYRGKTNTLQQITMLSNMRITSTQEAIALLRALPPLYNQVCFVLQRRSASEAMKQVAEPAPEPAPDPTPIPEPTPKLTPEKFDEDSGFSQSDAEQRIAELMEAEKEEKEEEETKEEVKATKTKKEKK